MILNSKIDSINEFECDQCLRFYLIINTDKRKFITTYHGQLYSEKKVKMLDRFAAQMDKIIFRHIKTIDSAFLFESLKEYLLPPPPPGENQTDIFMKYLPNRKEVNRN